MSNPFFARWTAKGSNLCLGHWEISHLGKPLDLRPEVKGNDMSTYGIYSYIYPDDEIFAEGDHEDDWIAANNEWLSSLFAAHGIPPDDMHFRWFYKAVNAQDWRCGSCGGCI
jgi:hypothetical protein